MSKLSVRYYLFLLCITPLPAEEVLIEFSYALADYNPGPIIESLVEGHRAEIRYQIRIYQELSGIGRLFGDRRVVEYDVVHVAWWNAINQEYIIRVDDDAEIVFGNAGGFMEHLFTLKNQRIAIPSESSDDLYVLCRPQIQPIKLVPPLTLMILLRPEYRQILPWRRVPFSIVK
ncbi:MAG: hypothetical protein CMN78_06010 [Spirochaetales bacterium]|nr:hypothetical protein [Spirochaetales bacterium]